VGFKARSSRGRRDLFADCMDVSDDLRRAYRLALRRYGRHPDVTGISIGRRHRKGIDLGAATIRLHVRRKIDVALLSSDRLIAGEVAGYLVDVDETDPADSYTTRRDPLRPGISIGPVDEAWAGTIGAIVRERATARVCILSAAHVMRTKGRRRVVQPAPLDGGSEENWIGSHLRSSRSTDAGVAVLNGTRGTNLVALGMTHALAGARWPYLGQVLEKAGRSTAVTRARIVDIGSFGALPAAFRLAPLAGAAGPICLSGDSGAVWMDPISRLGVGLHSKGPPGGSYGIATFLRDVLDDPYLSIQL
jgi:hypothetical protein